MAKQLDAPYVPGKRKGMAKVKRERDDRLRRDGLAARAKRRARSAR